MSLPKWLRCNFSRTRRFEGVGRDQRPINNAGLGKFRPASFRIAALLPDHKKPDTPISARSSGNQSNRGKHIRGGPCVGMLSQSRRTLELGKRSFGQPLGKSHIENFDAVFQNPFFQSTHGWYAGSRGALVELFFLIQLLPKLLYHIFKPMVLSFFLIQLNETLGRSEVATGPQTKFATFRNNYPQFGFCNL